MVKNSSLGNVALISADIILVVLTQCHHYSLYRAGTCTARPDRVTIGRVSVCSLTTTGSGGVTTVTDWFVLSDWSSAGISRSVPACGCSVNLLR